MTELITVQHECVGQLLCKAIDYFADFKNVRCPNLIKPYEIMMKHYGWETVPVFCSVPDKLRTRMDVNLYDEEYKRKVAIKLIIPDKDENLIRFQSYYDWTDLIYYTERPQDLEEGCTIDIIHENAFRYPDENNYWQATLPFIKYSWVDKIIKLSDYTEAILSKFTEGELSFGELIAIDCK